MNVWVCVCIFMCVYLYACFMREIPASPPAYSQAAHREPSIPPPLLPIPVSHPRAVCVYTCMRVCMLCASEDFSMWVCIRVCVHAYMCVMCGRVVLDVCVCVCVCVYACVGTSTCASKAIHYIMCQGSADQKKLQLSSNKQQRLCEWEKMLWREHGPLQ